MEAYRVLLVDDEEELRAGIRRKIDWDSLGFSLCGEAGNGQDALELAEHLNPDVVLTDIKMPFMDGLELCRRLKEQLPAVRLIVFSGFDDFEYARQAIGMNVFEYLLKPINALELSQVLARLHADMDTQRAEQQDVQALRQRYEDSLPLLRGLFYARVLDGQLMTRTIKSFFIRLLASALVLFLCLMTTGCIFPIQKETETLRIGVAVYLQEDTFIGTLVQDLERLAQERETEEDLKININVVDGRGSQTTQNDQIDRLIALDYDVLCVNIVDRTSAAVLIDKAQEAGIPIIFFNREPVEEDLLRWEHVYYVGAMAEDSGVLQGEIILDYWSKQKERVDRNGDNILQYVMLEGEPGHQDALLRTEYSVQTLSSAGVNVEKIASETANWDRTQAAARMTQWLQEYGTSIEAVISNNDDMALGAIDSLKNAEIPKEEMPLIVGVDATAPALDAIKNGTLQGTVLNDADGIAQALLSLSMALASGEDPSQVVELENAHYVWLPYQPITGTFS